MGQSQLERRPRPAEHEVRTCWREVLFGALSGLYPTDQQLEQMLDHLERTP
ncbi:MAG: hypothetical protein AAFY84_18030 [Pseudomonadota bacterium]